MDNENILIEIDTYYYSIGLNLLEIALLNKMIHNHIHYKWTVNYTKNQTIQKWFNCSKNTVIKMLNNLESKGLITIKRFNVNGSNYKRLIWITEKALKKYHELRNNNTNPSIEKIDNPLDKYYNE